MTPISVFVDASAWVAFFNRRDAHQTEARETMARLLHTGAPLVRSSSREPDKAMESPPNLSRPGILAQWRRFYALRNARVPSSAGAAIEHRWHRPSARSLCAVPSAVALYGGRGETSMPAVERVKLRMKIGLHELEAEGPRDVVMAQLDIWTRLAGLAAAAPTDRVGGDADPALRKLFNVDAEQQLVTLRVVLSGQRRNADAALLLLYGYQICLGADDAAEVPGARLRAALAASGHRLKRPDRALTPYLTAGLVRKGGRHKHETYALTAPGSQRAAALVKHLAGRR